MVVGNRPLPFRALPFRALPFRALPFSNSPLYAPYCLRASCGRCARIGGVYITYTVRCIRVRICVSEPSPTLSPTDPVPRGLLTLRPGAY